ncbi:hypothetical protein [Novosphingobium sp.]|uniref:hypothetical protein n=1 Tax=Novosphingobium sp. TaxID=1874826 RepID=UPI0026086550|nr:hypothetical protein [Novosphingobium sp.]
MIGYHVLVAKIVSATASLLAVALALGFALIAASVPFTAQRSVEAHQIALADLKSAAIFANSFRARIGTNPPDDAMRRWAATEGRSDVAASIGIDGDQSGNVFRVGCAQETSFHPAATDRFVLSYWNGDFFDCFAYPSGRTTLLTSWQSVMSDGGGWSAMMTFAGLSASFGFAGAWFGRKWRRLSPKSGQKRTIA